MHTHPPCKGTKRNSNVTKVSAWTRKCNICCYHWYQHYSLSTISSGDPRWLNPFFFVLEAKHMPSHWETLFNLRIFGTSQISLRQNLFIVQNSCNDKKYFTIFSSPKYDVVISLLSENEKATSIDILSTCFKVRSHTKADIIHLDEKKKPQRVAQWFFSLQSSECTSRSIFR